MRKLLLAALIGLSVASCQTPQQSAGTAGGVVAGAIVAGPVGAVVGRRCRRGRRGARRPARSGLLLRHHPARHDSVRSVGPPKGATLLAGRARDAERSAIYLLFQALRSAAIGRCTASKPALPRRRYRSARPRLSSGSWMRMKKSTAGKRAWKRGF